MGRAPREDPTTNDATPPADAPAEGVTQAAATAPADRDADGHLLDEWGLPVAGPLRVARLAELKRDDPVTLPIDEWGLPTSAAGLPWRRHKLERLGRADPLTDPKDW